MDSQKAQKTGETQDFNTIFVEGADFTSDKLEDSNDVTKLIQETLERQMEILKLNQMDQEELRTVVQL